MRRHALSILGLVTLVLLAAVPAFAETVAAPTVRVHGTETWTPVMVLALDEVAMLWAGEPRRATPPVLVDGASVLRIGRDAAAIRLSGVTTTTDLVVRARALRAANPQWETRLVLYAAGEKRSAKSRRLLTEEVAVMAADGTVTREHATDPLAVLDVAQSIAQRGGVASVEPVAAAPDYLQQRFKRKVAKLLRQDQPSERQEFFALKRLAPGERQIPVERYLQARQQMRLMPLHSTAGGDVRHPSSAALGLNFDTAAAFLGSWTPLGPGNIGGRTRAIVIDPTNTNVIYAGGVAGGVWKTTNGGGTWAALTDTLLPNLAVASLDMDPTNSGVLYAGTGEGVFNGDAVRGAGIFKTTDGGSTWNQLATTANSNFFFVNRIKVLSDGATVLAATRTGLWRSIDGGGTWSQVITASGVNGCFDIAAAPTYVLASCGTFAQGAVYRSASADASTAFTAVLGPSGSSLVVSTMGRTSIAIAPSNPLIVYALASSIASGNYHLGLDGVYKSADGGLSWSATVTNTNPTFLNTLLLTNPIFAVPCAGFNVFFNQGWYDNAIAVDPTNANRVWVGGIDLFRSDDGGFNWGLASFWWTGASPGAFAHADQHTIVFAPDFATSGAMYVGNDGGIFRTTNGATAGTTTNVCTSAGEGVSWTDLNNNYGVTQFYHGLPYPGPDGGNTFFGGTQDNGTILGTTGGGIGGWAQIQGGDGGYVAVDPTNTNVLYAETTGLSITKSVDGGVNFTDMVSGITDSGFLFITPFVMSPNSSQTLWTGGDRMWRTTNGAASWAAASAVLGCGSVSAIAVAPNAGAPSGIGNNVVMAGTSGGCVFRTGTGTTSTGATVWTKITSAGSGYVSWIAFDPSDATNVYVTHSTFGVPHVYRSMDAGLTFANIDGSGITGLPDVPTHTIAIAPGNPNKLYVGTDLGVFSSDDGGASWAVENTGFANVITEALAVGQVASADHLFAFTHGRGVFRVQLPASAADLTATVATVPTGAIVAVGGTVNVSNTIKNVGGQVTSAPFTVTFDLVPVDGSGVPTGSGTTLTETRDIAALAGNATNAATTPVTIPTGTSAGSYKINVRADVAGAVTEDTDRTNNDKLTNTFTIALPDLIVTAASATPASAGTGTSVSVANTVKNQGSVSTGASFHVTFLLSVGTGTTLTGSEIPLGVTRTVAALASNATSAATTSVTIPNGTTPGTYRIFVVADPENAIVEANESNNFLATNTITVGQSDLVPQTVTFTPAAAGGTTMVSVTHTVRNVATGGTAGGAPASVSGVYLSTDTTLAGAVVQLGTVNIPALAVGAMSTQTKSFTIPAGPPGTFFIVVQADDPNAITEASEANNVAASATRLLVGPDLLVTAATTTPAVVAPGGTVAVANTVKNQGTATTTSFGVTFFLVPTADTSGASDVALGVTRTVAGLGAGLTNSATTNVTIPAGTGPGQYKIRVRVDPAGVVDEANETNNQFLSTTMISVSLPDLKVPTVTAPPAVSAGTPFAVTNTVKNDSGVTAPGPFRVAFFLSTDTTFDGSDIPLGATRTVASLGPSAVSTATTMLTIPAGTPMGVYRVLVVADSTGVVVESDDNNNTGASGPVILGPDLIVTAAAVTPTTVAPGGTVAITNTVKNQGVTSTGAPFLVGFFLSSDSTFDGGDVPIGVSRTVATLAGSGISTATTNVGIPSGTTPGSYRILVVADVGGAVAEGNETNNVLASVPVTVTRPDLIVPTVTAPAAVTAGTPFAVTNTVKNNSGVTAPGPFSVAFFLSTDTTLDGSDIPLGATRTVASLGPNAVSTATTMLTIPAGTPLGVYRILAVADRTAVVVEGDDNNNTGFSAPVILGPDLVVTAATVTPAMIAPGGTFAVAHTIKNQGAATPTSFGVSFALVPVSDLSGASDIPLGVTRTVAGLGAGLTNSATSSFTTSLMLSPGQYRVRVIADSGSVVTEADETNNTLLTPTLTVTYADLIVTAVTAPPAVVAGTPFAVTNTVKNNSGVTVPRPFSVSFLLSTDTVEGSDIPLAVSRTVTTLGPNALSTATTMVTIPAGTPVGVYRVRVKADGTNQIAEQDDDNNNGYSGPVILGPDLVITAATVPASASPGAPVTVNFTVKNQGSTTTGTTFDVGFVVVPVVPPDPDIPLGPTRTGIPVLAPGASTALASVLTLPTSLTQGHTYQIRVIGDVNGAVGEADEANNEGLTNTFTIVLPDLSMTSFTPPATLIAGRTVALANTVKNNAAAPATAGPFEVGLYFSTDNVIDTGTDSLVGSRALTGLGPMLTSSVPISIIVPSTMGDFFLGAVADHLGAVAEVNEGNNVTVKPLAIVPDLVRTNVIATITFDISGGATCGGIITGSGQAAETITTQTGGAFSLGRLTFSDSGAGAGPGSDTVNFSGTVNSSGAITGTFTLSRVGGGGGSGSGTLTGTAAVGAPGSLTLDLSGTFTAAGLGTCGLTAHVTFP